MTAPFQQRIEAPQKSVKSESLKEAHTLRIEAKLFSPPGRTVHVTLHVTRGPAALPPAPPSVLLSSISAILTYLL